MNELYMYNDSQTNFIMSWVTGIAVDLFQSMTLEAAYRDLEENPHFRDTVSVACTYS